MSKTLATSAKWAFCTEQDPNVRRIFWRLNAGTRGLSFEEFFAGISSAHLARSALLQAWSRAPFRSFVWELPPLCRHTLKTPFRCALIDEPALSLPRADPTAFAEHFSESTGVAVFRNLGGDARLVVPTPGDNLDCYGHLAAFSRAAPEKKAHELLSTWARVSERSIGTEPLWISTSGLGVPWLHFRLDVRPKYYQCQEYRSAPSNAESPVPTQTRSFIRK